MSEGEKGFIDGNLLQSAIDTTGVHVQTEMIIEECAELIFALQKLKRNGGNSAEKLFNVCSEIADVKIMIAIAEKIFNQGLINEAIYAKMHRLKNKIIAGQL